MPVVVRGKSYQATVHHQGQRFRKTFRSRSEAEAWEMQTKAALLRGEIVSDTSSAVKGSPQSLQALYDMTYQRFWKNSRAEKSARINGLKCVEALGPNLPPAAVTERRIDDMVLMFEAEGLSDSTINRRLSALSKMLTFAYERGYIVRKPKIDRKKEPEHRIRYITEDEEKELLAFFHHIGQPDMADLCVIGIDTGMRMGEILRVEPRDLSNGLVSIWQTKSNKARSVPLTTRAAEVFTRRAAQKPESKIFEGWSHFRVRHYWDQARRHLGLMRDPQFVPHAMRHTFCSRLVQRGVDIVTVSKLAGHSNIVVTMRYAHLSPDNLVNAIRALESVKPARDDNLRDNDTPQ